jgi:hypothetical protein
VACRGLQAATKFAEDFEKEQREELQAAVKPVLTWTKAEELWNIPVTVRLRRSACPALSPLRSVERSAVLQEQKAATKLAEDLEKAGKKPVPLARQPAATVVARLNTQYRDDMQPRPVYPTTRVFGNESCDLTARNVDGLDVVMGLSDPRISGNVTLSAAVKRVVELTTLEAGKASCILGEYADPSRHTRAQVHQAEPSGSTCLKGRAHPEGTVFCAVRPRQNNPRCDCGEEEAADCLCDKKGWQNALVSLRGGPGGSRSSSGIELVKDQELREAVAEMALQLGLTSAIGAENNVQSARLMIFPVGDYKLREDCDMRDVTQEELSSLKAQSALPNVVLTSSAMDRKAAKSAATGSGRPAKHPQIVVTPSNGGMYVMTGRANVDLVHYVAAGSGALVDKEMLLSAHRDVDADRLTGASSLPDLTLSMTRYVACVKGGMLLGYARVVYVLWLFSSASAVAKAAKSSR